MFRSADGAGVGRLFLCGFTGHPPRPEITKTALGAEDHVGWEYWSRARDACEGLRAAGYRVLALERTPTCVGLEDAEIGERTALVVGHEVFGVSAETLEACDATVGIPMRGTKSSLNVAVAFGIAAYRLRERWEEITGRSADGVKSRARSRSPGP
jgi:tRNA G18 (ribose-2'-O)-methylase SpoU